jgi:hypothetical protein
MICPRLTCVRCGIADFNSDKLTQSADAVMHHQDQIATKLKGFKHGGTTTASLSTVSTKARARHRVDSVGQDVANAALSVDHKTHSNKRILPCYRRFKPLTNQA